MRGLSGKTAIIVGSCGGIGAATARGLAREGARVVLADVNLEGAEKVAAGIVADGGQAVAFKVDLADEATIKACIDFAVGRYGGLDILHNNASATHGAIMQHDGAIANMDGDVWDYVFRINTKGTMLAIKYALPHLLKSGNGAIINTTSGASLLGDLFRPAYAAAKAAVNSLTRYVAAQYGKQGVRCNCVSPGMVVTENTKVTVGDNFEIFERHHLTPYLGEPDDIAAMVLLLASDEGRFITGQTIVVDGGISSHFAHVADTRAGFEQYAEHQTAPDKSILASILAPKA